MNIRIVKTSTDSLIADYPIFLGGTLGLVEKDYFDEAWRCAVDDGLVDEDDKASYQFSIVD